MLVSVKDYTIIKSNTGDLVFVFPFSGNLLKDDPKVVYKKTRNSAILLKSKDIEIEFSRVNINAKTALISSKKLYCIETDEGDNVKDEYWVGVEVV